MLKKTRALSIEHTPHTQHLASVVCGWQQQCLLATITYHARPCSYVHLQKACPLSRCGWQAWAKMHWRLWPMSNDLKHTEAIFFRRFRLTDPFVYECLGHPNSVQLRSVTVQRLSVKLKKDLLERLWRLSIGSYIWNQGPSNHQYSAFLWLSLQP